MLNVKLFKQIRLIGCFTEHIIFGFAHVNVCSSVYAMFTEESCVIWKGWQTSLKFLVFF